MARRTAEFQTIRSEGGLLPADVLRRLVNPGNPMPGTRPEEYGLPASERINESITQSWNRLRKHWDEFKAARGKVAEDDAATGLTNDRWTLPVLRELGFGVLPTTPGPEVDGRTYPITRFLGSVPVHLVGAGVSLDRRSAGVAGAARVNPHGLVQEFLNRSSGHLWAVLSNGLRLRVMRDNQALSRQSFVEFDLAAMFEGEVYADFVVFWLVAHATRLTARDGGRADSCWLELWAKEAAEQGTRALKDLQKGVEKALQILGEGFTSHPRNAALREQLREGSLTPQELHGQLLRVVYRLIFLFVAEDRPIEGQSLLHARDDSDAGRAARERYAAHYSTARLRELAAKVKGSRHGDLWRQFQTLVVALSGAEAGQPVRKALALPGLGSLLWDPSSTAAVNAAELSNHDFLEVLRHLAFTRQDRVLRPVDYRNLGAEELGGVYESLLALTPTISADGTQFSFAEFHGSERKTTGAYYTHDVLVQALLDSALEPVVADAVSGKAAEEAEAALLALAVCDPAVGSGHFLVGAAHRLARHLARIRALALGESEPSPLLYQSAVRDVISRCLYGVDINPMAAELCRVSLWLEAMEPGRPLTFLEHHIRVGNSLLGATPECILSGIPDTAFKVLEGDDGNAASVLRKRNRRERSDVLPLLAEQDAESLRALSVAAGVLNEMPDADAGAVAAKAVAFQRFLNSDEAVRRRAVANAWCAAFMVQKRFSEPGRESSAVGITEGHVRALAAGMSVPTDIRQEIDLLAGRDKFFHWHLAFPEVFSRGGFDCVIGNPPWDTLSPDRREFFGRWVSGLRSMAPDEQGKRIEGLLDDAQIAAEWTGHTVFLASYSNFLRNAGVFTLHAQGNLGKGDFNVYRMFTELALRRGRDGGGAAMVLPGGIYGGANASEIRKHLLDHGRLRDLFGLINTTGRWFSDVDIDRFAAFGWSRGGRTVSFNARFGLAGPEDMPGVAVPIEAEVIRTLAPETYAIPDVRDLEQLKISRKMYAACPPLGDRSVGPPFRHYSRELDMGNNRDLFTTDPAGLPVYEGRMIDHYDHRAKTYESGHGNSAVWIERPFGDPAKAIVPQWRVLPANVPSKLGDRCDRYRIGFGDVANPRNERSFVATLIPPGAICGDKVPTLDFGAPENDWFFLPFLAVANSLSMDWLVRGRLSSPKMALNLVDSLPFPRLTRDAALFRQMSTRVLRLVCTSSEMTPFWNQMAAMEIVRPTNDQVPPEAALRDEERAELKAELEALVAREVFGLSEAELASQLETFEVLRRREEREYRAFVTKDRVLAAFRALAG